MHWTFIIWAIYLHIRAGVRVRVGYFRLGWFGLVFHNFVSKALFNLQDLLSFIRIILTSLFGRVSNSQ